jgi:hypothetical protein
MAPRYLLAPILQVFHISFSRSSNDDEQQPSIPHIIW